MKRIALTILHVVGFTGFLFAQNKDAELFGIVELNFTGQKYSTTDSPVRDVEMITHWRNGKKTIQVYGFYDGDGDGGLAGNQFKVRFCPTEPGEWTLEKVISNDEKLSGQLEGLVVQCTTSDHPGFWIPDQQSPGSRWFRRSNGTHQYFSGNTLYSYISEHDNEGKPTGGNILNDTKQSGQYFGKVRFSITGDIFPHPNEKPFLDNQGNPTDNGNFSHRPNPRWFQQRVDLAVDTYYQNDVIADVIINGPDSKDSRSILYAAENSGDNTPILRYIAARYGSYPNVWICLSNEFNIRNPNFTPQQISTFGYRIKEFLPYHTPLSVHANQHDWIVELTKEVPWNTHVILQNKLKTLYSAADFAEKNYWKAGAGKPVVNDELAYQGAGDEWSEEDVIEAHLGAFLGASYGSSGFKSGNKLGHYFMGDFDIEEHTAADNLKWMVDKINQHITFWEMAPTHYTYTRGNETSVFQFIDDSSRAMQWDDEEFVIGTDKAKKGIVAKLKDLKYTVIQFDVIKKTEKVITRNATGDYKFDVPDSRAVISFFKKNK